MGFNFWLAPCSKNGLVFSQPRIKSKASLLCAHPHIMCIFIILANQADQTAFYFQALQPQKLAGIFLVQNYLKCFATLCTSTYYVYLLDS